jgi:adenylate cyclase
MFDKPSASTVTAKNNMVLEDTLDTLKLGLGIFDGDLQLVYCNPLFQSMRSYPAALCVPGVSLQKHLDHDLQNAQLFYEGKAEPIEAWMKRARQRNSFSSEDALDDGRILSMSLTPSGKDHLLLIFSDVTEQSRGAQALRESREWYDLVSEASSEGIYDWNIETGDLRVSYRLTAMLGMSPGDLTSSDWNDRIHRDDFGLYRDALVKHFKGETPVLKIDYRVRRKSGDYIWFSDSGKCIRDADGRAIRLVGAVTNVTMQKLAEATLQKSEERYALAMQAINEGVYDWNIETGETYYSAGVRAALGLDPSQLKTANDWLDRVHPDDQTGWKSALVAHFRRQTERFECKVRYLGGNGKWRWARQHGIAQFNEQGRAVRMVGASGDITELIEHQEAARAARNHLSKAIETISDGFAIYDAEDRLVLCNDQYNALYPGLDDVLIPGTDYEHILRTLADRRLLTDIGDDVDAWVCARLQQRSRAAGPYQTLLSDGRWVNVSWRRTRDSGLVGVFTDITQLKTTELMLRESEERYALAVQSANEWIWDWDVEKGDIYVAPKLLSELGLAPDRRGRVSTDVWQRRIHPEDLPGFLDAVRAHLTGNTDFYSCEFRVLNAKDEYVWHYHRGVGQRDKNNRVYRATGSTTDVTSRKDAELRLRKSEERYALATAAATEGLYDWDVTADKLEVTPRLHAIMSLPEGSLTSSAWYERVHPNDAEKYRNVIRTHFKSDTSRLSTEYRVRSGRGDYIWVTDNATSVRDADQRVVRLVGAVSDITADKNAEQELREAKHRAETANQLAIEKAQALETLSTKLSKYLSPQVYSSIFAGQQNVEIDARRKKLTIFFSDIAGFTKIVDTLESEEVTSMLNEYLTEMSRIALKYGATIDKFIGDAILAFFGDPETYGPKQDALACVKMAIEMQRCLRDLQRGWRGMGLEHPFELRIGVTTGFCTVGNFGSEDRMDYTVVGNEVNLAARLQAHAETGGILLANETYALVKDDILAEDQGHVTLKGISRPIRAFKVTGIYDELAESGQIVRVDRPGVQLLINPSELNSVDKAGVVMALRDAVRRIEET